jgi:hypothetical protein
MKPGKYRHHKGSYYEVFGPALHTETGEKMVVYRGLYENPDLKEEYGDDPWFVRPYDMFTEKVEINGKLVDRFEYIGPM